MRTGEIVCSVFLLQFFFVYCFPNFYFDCVYIKKRNEYLFDCGAVAYMCRWFLFRYCDKKDAIEQGRMLRDGCVFVWPPVEAH